MMTTSNAAPTFAALLPRAIKLADHVASILEQGLAGERNGDWVQLDVKASMPAADDLSALKQAAVEVRDRLERAGVDDTLSQVAFLDRVENTLEYTLATICLNADGTVDAHVGRAGSAVRQLRGLVKRAREQVTSLMARPAAQVL
jgi:hypothetical protein